MRKYILIVDDNPSDQAVAEAICGKLDQVCITAGNGYEALDKIHDEELEFSLIVLDLQMPQMTGLELLKRLKKIEKVKDLPVVIMSGRKQDNDVSTAIRLGATDYIVKPIDSFIFEEKILKHMGEEDNEWQEFNIPAGEPARKAMLVQQAEIVRLSEIGCSIITNVSFAQEDVFRLFSKEMGEQQLLCKVESCELTTSGEYEVKIRFSGISEKQRKEIRRVCKELWRKHFSKMANIQKMEEAC
ncbi:MAG: response regulator [Bdellovibrionales bacterium]